MNKTAEVKETVKKAFQKRSLLLSGKGRVTLVGETEKTYKLSDGTTVTKDRVQKDVVLNRSGKTTTSNDYDYVVIHDADADADVKATVIYNSALPVNNMFELKTYCNNLVFNSTHFGKVGRDGMIKATFIYTRYGSFINYYKGTKTIELILAPTDILKCQQAHIVLDDNNRKDELHLFRDKVDNYSYLMKRVVVSSESVLKSVLEIISADNGIDNKDALQRLINQ